jgi:hypothetical protein
MEEILINRYQLVAEHFIEYRNDLWVAFHDGAPSIQNKREV